jgi:hypothetical protein
MANSCLPSWSWAGWQGEVDPTSWVTSYDYTTTASQNYRVKSIIQWYSHEWKIQKRGQLKAHVFDLESRFSAKIENLRQTGLDTNAVPT